MALLPVLLYPHPTLRRKLDPVTVFDAALAEHAANMLETMYKHQGAGLAANQVNYLGRMFVFDVSSDHSEPTVFINPEILARDGTTIDKHGCLSAPGIYPDSIIRSKQVRVRYQDVSGQFHECDSTSDYMAICIQHELDHLNGIMFFDHLSRLKRDRLLDKYRKIKDKIKDQMDGLI